MAEISTRTWAKKLAKEQGIGFFAFKTRKNVLKKIRKTFHDNIFVFYTSEKSRSLLLIKRNHNPMEP